MRARDIFALTFVVVLPIQLGLWHTTSFVDKAMWINHTQHVQAWDDQVFDKSVYGHPGAPVMVLAMILQPLLNQPLASTFLTGLALGISLAIAGAAAVCFALRPTSWWWLNTAGILALNPLYMISTPPTALESALVPGIIFLSWLLWERSAKADKRLWWLWGIAFGVAGATRADFSGFLLVAVLGFLVPRRGFKPLLVALLLAGLTFTAVDPFMWHVPIRHVGDLLRVAHYHYTSFDHVELPWLTMLLISPLATVSVGLGAVWLALHRWLPRAIPPLFLGWLLLTTAVFVWLLHQSQFQAPRYLFPLVFLWESLLPLYALGLLPAIVWEWWPAHRQPVAQRVMMSTLSFIVVGGQALMLLHLYYLPEVQLFCSEFCG